MRPQRADIAAPELSPGVRWLNAERRPRMAELVAAGPALVHFFDFAQLNSVRALPYVLAWRDRYAEAGLSVLGVHSPRFGFTRERPKLEAAIEHLGIEHPVADDSSYELWHDYGCRGWPSLFLWGVGGTLRWVHFGEGEYAGTETAIQEELARADAGFEPPPPLDPLRPEDAPGARVAPPSEEVLPGGSATAPWRPSGDFDALELEYAAGGAFAAVDGRGTLRVAIDGGDERELVVSAPGLIELASHPRHEAHRLFLRADAGLDLYSVAFAPAGP